MNTLKTTVLLGALTGLLLFLGYSFYGESGALLMLMISAAMNFGAYFWSDSLVLARYHAVPITREQAPTYYGIVEKLAQKAQIPMPRLFVLPDPALNAFATGRNPSHAAVAATQGILKAMTPEELEGVLAHELSHVINRDVLTSSIAATIAGTISWVAHSALWFGGRGQGDRDGKGLAGILMLVLAPIVAAIIQLSVSRSREFEADASGAHLVGYPDGLASALRKLEAAAGQIPLAGATPATAHLFIVNPLRGGLLSRLMSTHPPLEERIARLMAMNR